jgi:two-component system, OmpR family, sensor histidine kinase KdpD
MELLPHKVVHHRGATLKEFDLDAALARRPTLLLIDELAHTNAPGMRHAKRWQDVAELLDAGVNVYTTLNVQHLESVNDIVERISGVTVRETLPDSVLERADEVELVDIAPEELLERFQEGKVYSPDQAQRASKHFFTMGNLIALRELALRTTAQRVDAQMDEFRRANVIRTPWPATERILVCVGPSPLSARLVRAARRLAAGLKAPLIAAYVEAPASARLRAEDRRRVDETLRLAEQLGAQAVTLSGERVADEVIAYAAAHNVTKIVIGKPDQSRWRDFIFGSVVDDLIRRSGEIDIYVIRGGGPEVAHAAPPHTPARMDWAGFGWATAAVLATTVIGWPLYHHPLDLANENILMLYLLAVVWVATRHSRAAAVWASVLAVAAFDFIFVPPHYTFAVSDQQYIVTFSVMLATALVISALTHRVRDQAEAARERERRTGTLFALSRQLAAAGDPKQIVVVTVRQVADALDRRTILLLPDDDGRLILKGDSANAPESALDEKELSVAQWVFEHDQVAGAGTATLPAARLTFLPLKASRGTVGVLGLSHARETDKWRPEQQQLVEALASHAAVAVERAALAEEARQAWERVETEFLRNTLLSGVSHELRTPLAAITGAASTLTEAGERLDHATRAEMLDSIYAEAERMDRLINNLLDMTRLESGGMVVKKEWQPLQEVIGSALHRLDRRLRGRPVTTNVPADLPLVHIDGVLIEQVLMNLLDNAVEYTPPGTEIAIAAHAAGDAVKLDVSDAGPGIPPGAEERVFQKFFRANQQSTRRGIGLGLAISRGIVEAHGGTITARNRPEGGATFRIGLPTTTNPPIVDGSA